MDRQRSLVKNTIIIGFGTLLPKFASVIVLPIITACLTKYEVGQYELLATLVSLFLPITTLQIQSAAFRFLIDDKDDSYQRKSIITTIIAFVFIVSLISVFILFLFLTNFSFSLRITICLYFFTDLLLIVLQQVVRGLSENKLYSASTVLVSIINMVSVFITVYFYKNGLMGVIFSLFISTCIASVFIMVKINIISEFDLKYFSIKVLKKMISYSWPMLPNSLSNWALSLSDRLIITFFLGVEANAMYAIANKIPNLFTSIQGTFVLAWQENASIASKDNDVEKYYSQMFDNISSILFFVMSILIAITPVLYTLLIKGDYSSSYNQIPILYFALYFSALASFLGGIYIALKKTKSIGITTIVSAIVNVVTNLLMINFIGVYSGAISTLISYVLLCIYRMYNVQRFLKITYNMKKILSMIIIISIMCIFCVINSHLYNIINLFVGILFSCVFNKNVLVNLKKKFIRQKEGENI